MSCVVYTGHDVVPLKPGTEQRGTIALGSFLQQLRWLQRFGLQFIALRKLQAWLSAGEKIPKRAAVLTFDDGYESIREHVFPYLQKENIPFTIFVIAGFMGRQSNFYAHKETVLRRHLDTEALKELIQSKAVEIGSHGYHHLNLTQIDGDKLWHEIRGSKELLEDSLNINVPYFAYPYGRATHAVRQKAREAGYRLAFTTQKMKLASANIDLLSIPRVNWGRRATLFKLYKYYLIPWIRSAG